LFSLQGTPSCCYRELRGWNGSLSEARDLDYWYYLVRAFARVFESPYSCLDRQERKQDQEHRQGLEVLLKVCVQVETPLLSILSFDKIPKQNSNCHNGF
jgi:hypothetical protein